MILHVLTIRESAITQHHSALWQPENQQSKKHGPG